MAYGIDGAGEFTRGRDTDVRLVAAGWEVLRVWEHESIDNAANWIEVVVAFAHGPSISGPGAINVGRQVQRLKNRSRRDFRDSACWQAHGLPDTHVRRSSRPRNCR